MAPRDKNKGGPSHSKGRRGAEGDPLPKGKPGWGRVARKGAAAAQRNEKRDNPEHGASSRPEPQDEWKRSDRPKGTAQKRSGGGGRRSPKVKIDPAVLGSVPAAQRERTASRLGDAATAFSEERYEDARKVLATLAERYPGVPEIDELYGLTLYRLGRWKEAIRCLDGLYALTGSTEQHPVLADAHRAVGNHERVGELWDELRHDHPDADVITEGRIVRAGSLADQGDIQGAIRILEQGPVKSKAPQDYHLRLWYALADMYDRAGDSQRARRGFERVAKIDSGFADVRSRLNA